MFCNVCKKSDLKTFSKSDAKSKKRLQLGFCNVCGIFQQLEMPSTNDLLNYYSRAYREDYKSTLTPKKKHIWRAGEAALDRLDFLARAAPQNSERQKLLDIGSGGGEFVYLAQRRGYKAEGLEPNLGYANFGARNYDIKILNTDMYSLKSESFDIVTLFHVLEHLPDPLGAVKKIYDLLRPNGIFFVEVPNILQKDASPHNIFFAAHLFYFSSNSLGNILRPYFDLLRIEDKGNIKMILRKSDTADEEICNSYQSARGDYQVFIQRGWLQYFFFGNGWLKPIRKALKWCDELAVYRLQPKQILNVLNRINNRPLDRDCLFLKIRATSYKLLLFFLLGFCGIFFIF